MFLFFAVVKTCLNFNVSKLYDLNKRGPDSCCPVTYVAFDSNSFACNGTYCGRLPDVSVVPNTQTYSANDETTFYSNRTASDRSRRNHD